MKFDAEKIIQEILDIKQSVQSVYDQIKDVATKNMLESIIKDLTTVQQSVHTMTEEEIASSLERIVDFVNNRGATFEVVS